MSESLLFFCEEAVITVVVVSLFVILVISVYGTLACEEGPVSLLTILLRVPAHGRCSVNRWFDLSPFLLLTPLCVTSQSDLTPWHQEGRFF